MKIFQIEIFAFIFKRINALKEINVNIYTLKNTRKKKISRKKFRIEKLILIFNKINSIKVIIIRRCTFKNTRKKKFLRKIFKKDRFVLIFKNINVNKVIIVGICTIKYMEIINSFLIKKMDKICKSYNFNKIFANNLNKDLANLVKIVINSTKFLFVTFIRNQDNVKIANSVCTHMERNRSCYIRINPIEL
jgi:hypothetical protein